MWESFKKAATAVKTDFSGVVASVQSEATHMLQAVAENIAPIHVSEFDDFLYNDPKEGSDYEEFDAFRRSFKVEDHVDEINQILAQNPSMEEIHSELVPLEISYADFWARYYYWTAKKAERRDRLERERRENSLEERKADTSLSPSDIRQTASRETAPQLAPPQKLQQGSITPSAGSSFTSKEEQLAKDMEIWKARATKLLKKVKILEARDSSGDSNNDSLKAAVDKAYSEGFARGKEEAQQSTKSSKDATQSSLLHGHDETELDQIREEARREGQAIAERESKRNEDVIRQQVFEEAQELMQEEMKKRMEEAMEKGREEGFQLATEETQFLLDKAREEEFERGRVAGKEEANANDASSKVNREESDSEENDVREAALREAYEKGMKIGSQKLLEREKEIEDILQSVDASLEAARKEERQVADRVLSEERDKYEAAKKSFCKQAEERQAILKEKISHLEEQLAEVMSQAKVDSIKEEYEQVISKLQQDVSASKLETERLTALLEHEKESGSQKVAEFERQLRSLEVRETEKDMEISNLKQALSEASKAPHLEDGPNEELQSQLEQLRQQIEVERDAWDDRVRESNNELETLRRLVEDKAMEVEELNAARAIEQNEWSERLLQLKEEEYARGRADAEHDRATAAENDLQRARQEGLQEGRLLGYEEGKREGIVEGKAQGESEGRTSALEEFSKAFEEGRKEGYDQGLKEGLTAGRSEGYQAAKEELEKQRLIEMNEHMDKAVSEAAENGRSEGFEKGFEQGFAEAKEKYQRGYKEAEAAGYRRGIEECENRDQKRPTVEVANTSAEEVESLRNEAFEQGKELGRQEGFIEGLTKGREESSQQVHDTMGGRAVEADAAAGQEEKKKLEEELKLWKMRAVKLRKTYQDATAQMESKISAARDAGQIEGLQRGKQEAEALIKKHQEECERLKQEIVRLNSGQSHKNESEDADLSGQSDIQELNISGTLSQRGDWGEWE